MKKVIRQVPGQEMTQRTIPTSAPAMAQNGTIPRPKVPSTQSPILKRNTDSPVPNVKLPSLPLSSNSGGSIQASPSPKLYRYPLDKDKIDAMVKSAYKEQSDSVKVIRLQIIMSGKMLFLYSAKLKLFQRM